MFGQECINRNLFHTENDVAPAQIFCDQGAGCLVLLYFKYAVWRRTNQNFDAVCAGQFLHMFRGERGALLGVVFILLANTDSARDGVLSHAIPFDLT